ncbi:kinase-like domain-containing protein [Gigaspora rosea]|uniref:Kinase-like domain-containing protein n=1 Tax=Gigaspora rosea TaxID=44941 RepID=A0A397V8C0_9GLOM|nr:kinase-like domain-containing protein [Gigaspora rosea]
MDIDDVRNMDTLDTNSEVLKCSLSLAGKLAEATQPFVPLISSVFVIVAEALKIYENAKHNKNICASLLVRVNIAKVNVEILQLQPRICDYKAFYRFVEILKKIKNFMNDVSNLTSWKRYAFANSVKETFEKLISEFDRSMDDLHFTMSIFNEQQRKLDQEYLNSDIEEMKQFLEIIAGGVTDVESKINTVIDEVQIINKKVNHLIHDPNNTINLKAVKINPKELDDLPDMGTNLTKKSIVKKIYRGNDVACKFTNVIDNGSSGSQRIQAQLVILGKLKECPNILKFYGLSNVNDDQVMVFEWADKGNLKELYEKNDISWEEKIHISLDICRGLIFLQSCDILHHDIRCKNIMMTMRHQPKIANFRYSRETDQNTTYIENVKDIVNWMAPEKMSGNRYNFKCEIFRSIFNLLDILPTVYNNSYRANIL